MKKHDKNLPPEGHQPPPPPPEKHHKHERRRRRGGRGVIVFLILLVLLIAAGYILWQNGFFSFGKGNGDGEGSGSAVVSNSAATSEEISAEPESTIIEIKIDNNKIYFDGAEVASAEELKNKITEIGDKKTYNLVHETAIKATYDEVKEVLVELERALSIKVNYNDER
ncbi:MAG: hypothetical protein K2J77_12145 [Oscillospiraceae bacterium]|nr:hypothetical protein [Oscillospiraceae bacterium]